MAEVPICSLLDGGEPVEAGHRIATGHHRPPPPDAMNPKEKAGGKTRSNPLMGHLSLHFLKSRTAGYLVLKGRSEPLKLYAP